MQTAGHFHDLIDKATAAVAEGVGDDVAAFNPADDVFDPHRTLNAANTYTGGTTFAAGTLNAGSAGALGSTGTLSFTGGAL